MTDRIPCNRRLGEKVFITNNLIRSDTGYTPQQLVYGTTSGLPGLFEIPRNPNSEFARSLHRLIKGIQGTDDRAAPTPLGMDFPYEPGDKVHFLGPKGRIGHGRILTSVSDPYHFDADTNIFFTHSLTLLRHTKVTFRIASHDFEGDKRPYK